jgi:lambda repressor-like predicted transcriptional regulator
MVNGYRMQTAWGTRATPFASAQNVPRAEILFPNADDKGYPGLDLAEAEALAPAADPTAKDLLAAMDEQEAVFANRVRERMEAQGLSQTELAAKVGIGQPAVSMMLNRSCRPQRKMVLRFAQALGVPSEELWPELGSMK